MVQAHLAIAHLNLAQFPRALIRLQAAKVLGLQTPGLDETLTQVKRKIDEVAASTGPLPPVAALARGLRPRAGDRRAASPEGAAG